ncbi:MAG: hypothetical protein K0S56_4108 [Microvirga sp.]|jgi:hypothetical protein|nr:hypothetical protein [Microvirga sp.]
MNFSDAMNVAEKTLTQGLDPDRIIAVVRDLRALSPDSEIAARLEAKAKELRESARSDPKD